MTSVEYAALEHLTDTERTCVVRYLDLLRERLGLRLVEVHLFGSFAGGDAWPRASPMHSDVDLLIVCSEQPSEADLDDFVNATYPLFLECGRQISPVFKTRQALESPTTETGIAFLERFRN